nr:hypothetical protein [uncultured Rhodopila sp.]
MDRAGRARPAAAGWRSASIAGTIAAVDVPANTISAAGLSGGPVHAFEVHGLERQAHLPKIAPGSLLTATCASTAAPEVTPATQ